MLLVEDRRAKRMAMIADVIGTIAATVPRAGIEADAEELWIGMKIDLVVGNECGHRAVPRMKISTMIGAGIVVALVMLMVAVFAGVMVMQLEPA